MRRSMLRAREHVPTADQRVFIHGLSWSDFEHFLKMRGDASGPRMTYSEGVLELMSPSRNHEGIAALIGCLVELYADETDRDITPFGSWTLKSEVQKKGVEPDECYIIGEPGERETPDLVIEVVWTSGGLEKLEIYHSLNVPEFWQWDEGRIQVHVLRKGRYVLSSRSRLFPELDMQLIASCALLSTRRKALQAFRKGLVRKGRRRGRE